MPVPEPADKPGSPNAATMLQKFILQLFIWTILSTFVKMAAYEPRLPYIEGVKDVNCAEDHVCRFFYVTYIPPYIFDEKYMKSQPRGLFDDALSHCMAVFSIMGVYLEPTTIRLISRHFEHRHPRQSIDCAQAFAASDVTVQYSPPFTGSSSAMGVKTKTSGDRLSAYEIYMDTMYAAKPNLHGLTTFTEMVLPRLPLPLTNPTRPTTDCCTAKHYLSSYMLVAFIESCPMDCSLVGKNVNYFGKNRTWVDKLNTVKRADSPFSPYDSVYSPYNIPYPEAPPPPDTSKFVADSGDDEGKSKKEAKKDVNWYLCFVILGVLFLLLAVISVFAIILLFLIHADRKRVQKAVAKRSVMMANEETNGEPLLLDGAIETESPKPPKSPSKRLT